jgi:hypothetical protein
VWLARACFDLVHKADHCLCHSVAHGLEVKAVLAVAGGFPGPGGLGGFALGLFLRNEVAAQERQQSLCEGGGAAFFSAALLFGRLALQLDGELDERDAAFAELVRKGIGDLSLALVDGGQQRLREAAARPDRGEGFVRIGVLAALTQRIVGGVEDRAGRREVRRSAGQVFVLQWVLRGDRAVAHADSFQNKTRNAPGALRAWKNNSLNSEYQFSG